MSDGNHRLREFGVTAGTLGATSAQTLMVALLPVLLVEHAPSAIWIGIVVASEGFFSLVLPYFVGRMSDHVPGWLARKIGRRNLFLLIATPMMMLGLVAAPFLGSYWALAAAAFLFFAFLRVYVTPLWALMIDSVPRGRWGRVEGVRGVLHSIGLSFGLVGGGMLYGIWEPLPFITAAGLLVVTTGLTYFATPDDSLERVSRSEARRRRDELDSRAEQDDDRTTDEEGGELPSGTAAGVREEAPGEQGDGDRSIWRELRRDAPLRWFLIAHAFWTAAVDGIRPYIFIFASVVLGVQVAQASLLLLALLVGLAAGSLATGWLSDRMSRALLLMISACVLGAAMTAGVFIRSVPLALALLLPVGFGAAALISLPYPLFATLVGDRPIGQYTGVYGWAVGVAQLFPPILVGAAIDAASPLFPEERGYPIMWPVVGVMALAGAASLYRVTRLPQTPGEVRRLSASPRRSD